MITFLIGLIILFVGGAVYGKFCEKIFEPDERKTPAFEKQDGVDYVPMDVKKNSLVNLLNIAGTGPILGPIQGILFGPIAFISIPIGNILGGAVHDYFCGMICTREKGIQMPDMIKKYTNKGIFWLYTIFLSLLLLLVGTVFIYTPGDIAATQVFGFGGTAGEVSTWVIYSVIFIYYLVATVFPIDKIIGKVYPVFGAVLILSAIGIFAAIFFRGYPLTEVGSAWSLNGFDFGAYFRSEHFIPSFFVTVACGILSGFHSSQTSLISRTIQSEKHGRMTFFNMMVAEGFIAMVWAAATMGMIGLGAKSAGITMKMTEAGWTYFQQAGDTLRQISATSVVGVICKHALGSVGGIIAIVGVIVLPITSGDTALRSLRLTLTDIFHLKQDNNAKRLMLAVPVFAVVYLLLIWSKINPAGFNILWRYFAWSNQTLAIFALSCIVIYLMSHGKEKFIWVPLIPLLFYAFVISSYLLNAQIGFGLSWIVAYIGGAVFTVVIAGLTLYKGKKIANS